MKLVPHGFLTHGKGWGSSCGQASLATLVGCTIEEAVLAIGHRHSTVYNDLRRGLRRFNIAYGRKTKGRPPQRPGTYLMLINDVHNHWSIQHNKLIYDSTFGFMWEYPKEKGIQYLSYIKIYLSGKPQKR